MADQYLLLSVKHSPGYEGKALWWAKDRKGYTEDVELAGRYSKSESEEITADEFSETIAILEAEVMSKSERLVSVRWGKACYAWATAKETNHGN